MSRRAPALTARAWLGAAAGSTVIHALAVLALVRGGGTAASTTGVSGLSGTWWHRAEMDLPQESAWVDVVDIDPPRESPPLAAPVVDSPAASALAVSPLADRDHHQVAPVAPRIAEGRDRRAPSADEGARAGRTTDDDWRRDRSTLHARLTDGAAVSQPARSDTASRPASPQAVRREPLVGAGDATHTDTPASVPSAPQYAAQDESAVANAAAATAPGARAADQVVAGVELPRLADTANLLRGVGPLDAEPGPRSFDSDARGAAGDDRSRRAASDERRPGITDFSQAGVRAQENAPTGRGPGTAPGAVDRPVRGRSPTEYGGATASTAGPEVSEATQDRPHQVYFQEIARRVNSVRDFPKRLALRLEQGETVVKFVLGKDGRIVSGVHVMKSAGFDEFDSAAARAVERAAPFPPMPTSFSERSLTVSVRVAFENPMVR
jgi:TonB family protein